MEVPAWAVIFQVDDEWCFRSLDWLVMGEGYSNYDDAVRGAWEHHETVMGSHEESLQGLNALEAELMLTRKELLVMFVAAYEAQYPMAKPPSVLMIAREKWGKDVAEKLFPDISGNDEECED